MNALRDYQRDAYLDLKRKLFEEKKRSVVSQLPTGAGKTVIVAAIVKTVQENNENRKKDEKAKTWFIVPRKELIEQTKKHYAKLGIKFGIIDAKHEESRAYDNHIASLQTLLRRLDKIKEFPDVVFFDECHINYDAQLKIMRYFLCALYCDKWEIQIYNDELGSKEPCKFCIEKQKPCAEICGEKNKIIVNEENPDEEIIIEPCEHWKEYREEKPKNYFIGLTATPERMDGRGLGTLYDDICYGPPIPWLVQRGFLSELVYYAPPTDGVRELKFKSTGEVDQNELDKLLTERAIYGRAVDYYEKLAKLPDGSYRRGVGFCADIKAAQKQAAEFRSRGFKAEAIWGVDNAEMTEKKQRALYDGLDDGRIQVLCSADLLLYGWDQPKVSYGFLLRRTKSKERYVQIFGRLLRVADGKPDAIFVDHTATIDLHTDPAYPGVPLDKLEHINWNFHGKGREKKSAAPQLDVRLCPYDNYRVCDKPIRCPQCERYIPKENEEIIIESIPLQERIAQMTPHVITPAEKREYQDAVIKAVQAAREADGDEAYDKAVKELCEIAEKLEYRPMWVYYRLSEEKYTVNVRALHSIARAKGYKPYWTKAEADRIREQLQEATA